MGINSELISLTSMVAFFIQDKQSVALYTYYDNIHLLLLYGHSVTWQLVFGEPTVMVKPSMHVYITSETIKYNSPTNLNGLYWPTKYTQFI